MEVAKITANKANEITGKKFSENKEYNPVKDKSGNWIISLLESSTLDKRDYELIEFEPVEITEDEI